MKAAENIGGIPLRGGGMIATAKLLLFDGDAYAVFAYVETAILVNEAQGSERLNYTQRTMIDQMVWKATCDLIAIEDSAVTWYAAGSSSAAIKPEQRATASVKLAYHRNRREAFLKISETPEDFITVATQPLQSSPILGTLDVTAQLIPRDDSDREVSRRCASLGWTFARQSAITTVIVRKGCDTARPMLVRPCQWHNASSAHRPRLLPVSSGPTDRSPRSSSCRRRNSPRTASLPTSSRPNSTSLRVTNRGIMAPLLLLMLAIPTKPPTSFPTPLMPMSPLCGR